MPFDAAWVAAAPVPCHPEAGSAAPGASAACQSAQRTLGLDLTTVTQQKDGSNLQTVGWCQCQDVLKAWPYTDGAACLNRAAETLKQVRPHRRSMPVCCSASVGCALPTAIPGEERTQCVSHVCQQGIFPGPGVGRWDNK